MSKRWFSRMTRRRFLKLLPAGAALGGLSRYTPQLFAAPAKTVRVVSGEADGPSGTIDPAFGSQDADGARTSLVYDRLVTIDDGFTPRPQLAESWQSNDKADVWTFKIRRGVEFHNGGMLTSKDVAYTFRRLLDTQIGSPAKAQLTGIDPDGIDAVDDHTVRFRLSSAIVEFPRAIANRFTYIVPAGSTKEDLRSHGVGTGPFKQERFVPGEEPSIFVKNDRYWQRGLPLADSVELRSIPEEAARVAALERGQVDLVMDIPLTAVDRLRRNPNIKVISVRSPFLLMLACWIDTPPFDDNRVRLAMKYCVDRQKVLQLVLAGQGTIANDDPVAPWIEYGLAEPPRKPDIEKAKALLAEAGHRDGLKVELWTSKAITGMEELATVFKEMTAPAGIDVEIKEAAADDYWDKIWLKQPFIASGWSGRPADDALAVAYLSDAKWNETHWKRPEFDQLIHQARQTVSYDKRKALYQKAQRMLIEEGGALIPVYVNALSATSAKINGWSPHPQKFLKDFRHVSIAG